MNLRSADLHTHSTYSDGSHSPSEVVDFAAAAGIDIVALTDHDTTRGVAEAESAAGRAGIEFVPGIEISALHDGEEYHILGYFVGESAELADYTHRMANRRSARIDEILDRLRSADVQIDPALVVARTQGLATRAHVARSMVVGGYVGTVAEAFSQYLGPGCIGYVPAAIISVEDAIRLIHASGGAASLAHPGEWVRSDTITAMKGMGLDAIEVVHPSHDERLTAYYRGVAATLGLSMTGGSDLHQVAGGRSVPVGSYCVSSNEVDSLRTRARSRIPRAPGSFESNS